MLWHKEMFSERVTELYWSTAAAGGGGGGGGAVAEGDTPNDSPQPGSG